MGGQDQGHRGAARVGGRLILQISQVQVVMNLLTSSHIAYFFQVSLPAQRGPGLSQVLAYLYQVQDHVFHVYLPFIPQLLFSVGTSNIG